MRHCCNAQEARPLHRTPGAAGRFKADRRWFRVAARLSKEPRQRLRRSNMDVRRVECLDGLRGLAALWVLVGHMMILTGRSAADTSDLQPLIRSSYAVFY